MTVIALTGAILLSLCVIVVFSASILRKYAPPQESPGIPAIIFTLWLLATAVWGRPFFELKIPGLFDPTIDRMLLVIMLALIFVGLYTGAVGFRKRAAIELAMFAFAAVCLVSMAGHGFTPEMLSLPSPWNNFINGYLFPFAAFLFAKSYIRRPRDIRMVFTALFLFGTYLSITAFFEFFNLPDFVFPRYISNPDILIHLDRARGPFLNAAFNGAAIITGFICGMHLLPERKRFGRPLHVFLLYLSFPAVFFTQTRSAYIGLLVALGIFLCAYRTSFIKWKAFALPVALLLVFLLASIPRMASGDRRSGGVVQTYEVEVRMNLINRCLGIAAMQPFTGVGFGQFLPVSMRSFPGEISSQSSHEELQHFHLLGMLAELGIAGVSLYVAIVVLIFRRFAQLRALLPETGFISRNLVLAFTAIWVVYIVTNMTVEPAYCLFFNSVPFACAGLADGLYARAAL